MLFFVRVPVVMVSPTAIDALTKTVVIAMVVVVMIIW